MNGKNVQAHHQHYTTQCEEELFTSGGCVDQLLPKALFLHKQDPAHGGNVGHADTEMTEHYLHVLQHRHPAGAYPRNRSSKN